MADHSRSSSPHFCGMLSIGTVCRACKACKSLVSKRHHHLEKNPSPNKVEAEEKPKSIKEDHKVLHDKNQNEKTSNDVHDLKHHVEEIHGHDAFFKHHRTVDNYFTSSPLPSPSPLSRSNSTITHSRSMSPSPLLRSASGRSQTPKRAGPGSLLKSLSRRSVESTPAPSSLSRSGSRRSSTIMYSNSSGLMKPLALEKKLECTLEELCFGCIKKVKITRDVVTNNGEIVQEDELLTIKVKPGWTKGTKITFEGMGNETPGTYPGDVNFVIAEKRHPLFRREGDDLELAIEVPLVKALTGCTLSIPLVGAENTSLTIEDIIYPGYKKTIEGQGMPMPKEQGKRGNLILKFLVEFPDELTDKQRSDVYSILQDSFDHEICSP